MTTFLTIIYFAGIASCGIQGAEKGMRMRVNWIKHLMSAFLSAFAGGIIRDVILLNTHPTALTTTCLPDITIALVSALIYMRISPKKYIQILSFWADAIGLSQFIAIGIDKANSNEATAFITFLCGITTALGGGIISSFFSGEPINKIMSSNISYRLSAITGTIFYMDWINCGVDISIAQVKLMLFTLLSSSVCNINVRRAIKKFSVNIIVVILQCSVITRHLNIPSETTILTLTHTSKPLFYFKYDIYKNYRHSHFYYLINRHLIIFRLHRILQM